MKKTLFNLLVVTALILVMGVVVSIAKPLPDNHRPQIGDKSSDLELTPQPATVDEVTLNQSNIVTTMDNFGYIGGLSAYGLPSGEWPRNSGHDYLAEINYWIGGKTPDDSVRVADTKEDFQALPMPVKGQDVYRIYLSTDTTRYYNYDVSDTVGSGVGSPARGWRIWDYSSEDWVYNTKYNSLASAYTTAGPTSLQDSYCRFGDNATGSPAMGIEVSHSTMGWNYCYNEDFIFVKLEIYNASEVDYTDFGVGLYIDIDVGGEDGLGENGRLQDVVAYDTTKNLAWIYDNIGYDPGWGPTVRTGVMGTKLLSTPNNVGMTAFRTDDWSYLPDEDNGRYAMISSTQFDDPLPPTDQFYVQVCGGFTLAAGQSVELVYALIAGEDEDDFKSNADRAQEIFSNNYIGPEPPATPTLSVHPGDEKVYLHWNDTAEFSIDPQSQENDFVGYKLYRSSNQGITWGVEKKHLDNNCMSVDYEPVAIYRRSVQNQPVVHSFVDTGLYNGVEYWYALVAFDSGSVAFDVDPLQTGFGIAGEASHVVKVTPRTDPAGFYNAATTVTHSYTGNKRASSGEVVPVVFDSDSITGDNYRVVFEDTPDQTYWHFINETTGGYHSGQSDGISHRGRPQ